MTLIRCSCGTTYDADGWLDAMTAAALRADGMKNAAEVISEQQEEQS
jgi:hypothetical protein